MADDARLEILIEANVKQINTTLAKLEKDVSGSFSRQAKSVKTLESSFATMQARALKAGAALGIVFGTREIVEFVKRGVEAGKAIEDLSTKLGLGTEATQELSYAAQQSGVATDSLVTAFKGMSAVISDAERGSKTANAQLAELGLTLADIKGKSPDQVFELLANQITKIQDPLTRTNELVKFFGKSGADLAPLVLKGAAGIEALRQKARDLGIVLSDDTIKKAAEAADKINDIGAAGQAAGVSMAAQFLPAIDALEKLVTSQSFQKGLSDTAGAIGTIIKWLAENPDAAKALGIVAAGYAVGGLKGAGIAAAGLAAGQLVPGPAGPAAETVTIGGRKMTLDQARALYPNPADLARAVGINPSGSPGALRAPGSYPRPSGGSITAGGDVPGNPPPLVDQTADHERLEKALEGINNQLQVAIKNYDQMRSVGNAAIDTLIDDFAEAKSGAEILGDVLKNLAQQLLKMGETQLGNALFGATGSTDPGLFGNFLSSVLGLTPRAGGGPVSAGTGYMVGERGPEFFMPNSAGRIMPANSNWGGGGGSSLNIHVDVTGARGNAEIQEMVARGVQAGIGIYDKTKARQQVLAG